MQSKLNRWTWVSILLLIVGLAGWLGFFREWSDNKAYEENARTMLDQSLNVRLELAALDADTAIESIRQQAAERTVLEQLGSLALQLRSAEASIFSISPYFENRGATAYLIYNVLGDYALSVEQDFAGEITSDVLGQADGRNKMIRLLEILSKDLTRLRENLGGTELFSGDPGLIEEIWRDTVRDIVVQNEELPLHNRIKLKYGFDAEDGS